MSVAYTCRGCFTTQALYPNLVAPGPWPYVNVACPDCGVVSAHRPHPALVESTRRWAAVCVEVDVQLFRRQLDRGVSA